MKHIASIATIPVAAFVALAFLAGCETPADDFVSDELVEINGELISANDMNAQCSFVSVAGKKKCDGKTRYQAKYKGADQSVDTKLKSLMAAKRACGDWAVANLTPSNPNSGASCPGCPKGTKGCEVINAHAWTKNTVWNNATQTYHCKGSPVKVYYNCSVCTLGKGLCTDIILDGIEISGFDETELELFESTDESTDESDDSLSKPKPKPAQDAQDADDADDADKDGTDASIKPADKRAKK